MASRDRRRGFGRAGDGEAPAQGAALRVPARGPVGGLGAIRADQSILVAASAKTFRPAVDAPRGS
jgi:hypothetical protein